jgi:hypothetical protein
MGCQTVQQCARDDELLKELTFLRYVVLGLVMLFQLWKLSVKAVEAYATGASAGHRDPHKRFVGCHPFEEHPTISTKLATATCLPTRFFWAGCLFFLSEGVGLAVYFGVSFLMDNIAIFLAPSATPCFCEYVISVALYTFSLVSFLPTAVFAYFFQRRWYEGKPWNPMRAEHLYSSKSGFIAAMILITVSFFILRLELVRVTGWYAIVDKLLGKLGAIKVWFAICVPPLMDFLQSQLLIMASKLQDHAHDSASASQVGASSTAAVEGPLRIGIGKGASLV